MSHVFRHVISSGFKFKYNKILSRRTLSSSRGEMSLSKDNIIWVDLEMTGLDVRSEKIMEIACLITDKHLNILAEGPNIIIHQPDSVLEGMGEWCVAHHGESGLTESSRNSKISVEEADEMVVEFVKKFSPPGSCPLGGNTVHADKEFLKEYMPKFHQHLHYRIIDVSSIKEVCKRWFVDEFNKAPRKKCNHRAMDDIRESIAELQYYRESIFKTE